MKKGINCGGMRKHWPSKWQPATLTIEPLAFPAHSLQYFVRWGLLDPRKVIDLLENKDMYCAELV